MWTRKDVECHRQSLMRDSDGSSEDQIGDSKDSSEVSDGNKNFLRIDYRPFMLHSGNELVCILSLS
jgi:hypothetical protein